MIVRDAQINDFLQMGNIFKQVDGLHIEAHPKIFNPPMDNVRSKEYIDSVLENEKSKLIVVLDNEKVIGLAKADIESAPNIPLFVQRDWLSISTIVVDENHRGKGVGKKLLNYLYDWAIEHKVTEVELTVFSFNDSAIKFYESNGFSVYRTKMHRNLDDNIKVDNNE